MIVFLGGVTGSGKRPLAVHLARQRGWHFLDAHSARLRWHVRQPDGSVREEVIRPINDAMQIAVYDRLLKDMPKLAKMYPEMVVQDSFLRAAPREYFFNAVKNFFRDAKFVWVETSESDALLRLQKLAERGRIRNLDVTLARREADKKMFESFEGRGIDVRVFENRYPSSQQIERLKKLLDE